jgi:UDP-glucoronosyl and UDP-glucosyl transferase
MFFRKYFPEKDYLTFDQMKQKVSLVLLNTHFSSNGPRPYLPNMIEIGGIQVKPEASVLPKVIQSSYENRLSISFSFHFRICKTSLTLPLMVQFS